MSEHTAVTTQQDPIYEMLMKYKGAVASVLPKHLTPERMLRIGYQVIHRTPKLRQCSPASLINGLIEISMLGLDIGRTGHLIPFKNEAVVIVDYKGMIELAHRSGQINSLPFKPVYENDFFDYEEGTNRYIKHKPATKDRGDLIAAYAIANFKHGGFDFEVVHPVDIEAVKKVAPGAKSSDSPWNNPDQQWTMWCKTAVRRLSKRIPQSPELRRVTELEDLVEAGLSQQISHIAGELTDQTPPPPQNNSLGDPHEAIKKKLEETQGQTEPEIFQCPHCDFKSESERGLKKHITQSHKQKSIGNNPPEENQSSAGSSESIEEGSTGASQSTWADDSFWERNMKEYPEVLGLPLFNRILARFENAKSIEEVPVLRREVCWVEMSKELDKITTSSI